MQAFFNRFQSPNALIILVGLWLLTAGNVVLWTHVAHLVSVPVLLTLAAAWLCVWFAMLQWLMWPGVIKWVLVMFAITASCTSYFMSTYGVVIDPSMMRNAFATNTHEAFDLLSWRLIVFVGLIAGPVFVLIWKWNIRWTWTWQSIVQRLVWSFGALVVGLGLIWMVYADLASMMRNDRSIRYQITPFNALYSSVRALTPKLDTRQRALISVGDDAVLSKTSSQPTLLVMVVGETARAANFGLGGYARNTTPNMQRRMDQGRMVYWDQVESCGTNTEVSVPCMFSPLKASEGADKPPTHQNLLDVLSKAGLGVYWVDNQSGCKGVCDRVPTLNIEGKGDPRFCSQGECLDEVLVQQLDQAMQSISEAQKQRGVVLVLHQMGSHGPAYFKRAPSDGKSFMPECQSTVLSECSAEALRNTYDNSILYTDKVLEEVVLWLEYQGRSQGFAPAMIYASDHGESLGEKGMYLHGAPRWMAPKEQVHIPMLAWYSASLLSHGQTTVDCLKTHAHEPKNHDFLFHSVLGMMGVSTQAYQPQLDWRTHCSHS